jgi:hypothetical protein
MEKKIDRCCFFLNFSFLAAFLKNLAELWVIGIRDAFLSEPLFPHLCTTEDGR